jgi:short-subunit dehydrogenase
MSIKGKVALVTGASSGIGKKTVQVLLEEGVKVYAAARRVERMKDLNENGAYIINLDLTSDESIEICVKKILETEKSIDILINNAGYGSYGSIEDVPIDEARRQFEVNIFGLAKITQLIIPKMRENNYGKIVNISSIGGKIYTSFGGWYHATKHALEGLSDCLRLETKLFGIDVIIIEPGAIRTEWDGISADNLKIISKDGAYSKEADKIANGLKKMYSSKYVSKPDVISLLILKSLKTNKPKTRYSAGYMAKISLITRWLVSDSIFDKIVSKMM